ncbi:hypothetical protein BH09GEM1_BH09GEM1_22700 [soil metagenome]
MFKYVAALTEQVDTLLQSHLLRNDGEEDLFLRCIGL